MAEGEKAKDGAASMEEGVEEENQNEGRRLEEGEKFLYKGDSVKLISAEGFEFIIDRKAAIVSNMLRNMLSSAVVR